jgi:hypothetical protein
MLEIALAIQDHVSWQVHTGLYSSVRGDMWNHNWRATQDEWERWGLSFEDGFIQNESDRRGVEAQLAANMAQAQTREMSVMKASNHVWGEANEVMIRQQINEDG